MFFMRAHDIFLDLGAAALVRRRRLRACVQCDQHVFCGKEASARCAAAAMRIALCIVGQLLRLELTSKVHFLNEHSNVDAFLVLQTTIRYSRTVANATRRCGATAISRQQTELLRPVHTSWIPPAKLALPDMMKPRMSTAKYRTLDLFDLHVYQYQNWRQCALDVQEHEVHTGMTYDYLLRVRDNAIIVDGNLLVQTFAPGYCTTKACNAWGGLHDKVMSCPRRFLQPMLRDAAERFLFRDAQYASDRNTETTLARTMRDAGVEVRTISWFPVHDARPCACNATHHLEWCRSKSDCVPKRLKNASRLPALIRKP